jgi:hypothetical protein
MHNTIISYTGRLYCFGYQAGGSFYNTLKEKRYIRIGVIFISDFFFFLLLMASSSHPLVSQPKLLTIYPTQLMTACMPITNLLGPPLGVAYPPYRRSQNPRPLLTGHANRSCRRPSGERWPI